MGRKEVIQLITMDKLKLGESAIVEKVSAKSDIRRRFSDIGLIKGTNVKCVSVSPLGDPKAFLIRGAVIVIRNCDSNTIILRY